MLSTFGIQIVLVDVTVDSMPVGSPSSSLANVWADIRINDSRPLSCKLAADSVSSSSSSECAATSPGFSESHETFPCCFLREGIDPAFSEKIVVGISCMNLCITLHYHVGKLEWTADSRQSRALLGGPWDLVTTYNWA